MHDNFFLFSRGGGILLAEMFELFVVLWDEIGLIHRPCSFEQAADKPPHKVASAF